MLLAGLKFAFAVFVDIVPLNTLKVSRELNIACLSNEADYDKKQKQAYRQIMLLYHTDRVNHLNIPADEKQTVTAAFTSVSQTINRLMNINYHFKKKKD